MKCSLFLLSRNYFHPVSVFNVIKMILICFFDVMMIIKGAIYKLTSILLRDLYVGGICGIVCALNLTTFIIFTLLRMIFVCMPTNSIEFKKWSIVSQLLPEMVCRYFESLVFYHVTFCMFYQISEEKSHVIV